MTVLSQRYPHLAALVAAAGDNAPAMLDEFAGLERLAQLNRDELASMLTGLRELAGALREADRTDDNVAVLQDVATAVGDVREAETKLQDRETVAASLLASISGDGPAPSTDSPPARPALGEIRAPSIRAPRRSASPSVRATVTAGGSPLESVAAIAEQLHSAGKGIQSSGDGTGASAVASLTTAWPEELTLNRDPVRNAELLDRRLGPAALTAAGGVCGPVSVDYSIPTFASQERPLRDGLPRFGADRGGVTFTAPPTLAALAGATVVWTEANDVSPSSPSTKPVGTISCTDPTTVLVDAIPTRLRVGNFLARFNPEQQAAQLETALAAAARIAELNLQAAIDGHSVEVLSTAYLGAARDLLATIDLACAAMRYRQRIPRTTTMRVVLPEFTRDMLRADIARQLATDTSDDMGGALAVTDAEIDNWFSVRGIRPIWTLDGRAAGGGTGRTYALQGFAAQTAGGLVGWPAKVVFSVFPEGSFVFLDGGALNIGVIRDSTLNNTNDAELFFEPFEQVAFRGIEALKVVAPIAPNGGSAGSIAESTYTAGA